MDPFIAPRFNLALNWTADILMPVFLKTIHNITEVVISDPDKEMLRKLHGKRVLFFTNHPSNAEPTIAFYVGNVIGSRFRYMASRQIFDWGYGLFGKILANVGAFSVIAGINDRESLKTARSILCEKNGKLVVFPEGEPTSGENDTLMPIQEGLASLGFWALEDAKEIDNKADIVLLPGFIKYVLDAPREVIMEDLIKSISRMEARYSIQAGNKNLLRRYLTVGKYILLEVEGEYGIENADAGSFDYRIGRVRHTILDRIAEKLKPPNYDKNADAIQKLRIIFALLEMIIIDYPDPKLPRLKEDELSYYKREAIKAYDFIVIKREYLLSYPTAERFYEWNSRFESYLFGETPRALGGVANHLPRKAYISFSEPYSLDKYYKDYKKSKKNTIDLLINSLRNDLHSTLDHSLKLSEPLVKPYDLGE